MTPLGNVTVADWPTRMRGSASSATSADSSTWPSRAMRNQGVAPTADMSPGRTFFSRITPETGAETESFWRWVVSARRLARATSA